MNKLALVLFALIGLPIIGAILHSVSEVTASLVFLVFFLLSLIALFVPLPIWPLRSRRRALMMLIGAIITAMVLAEPPEKSGSQAPEAATPARNDEVDRNRTQVAEKPKVKMYGEADIYWDEYTRPYKQVVIAGVNKMANENKRCHEIDPSSAARSSSRGSEADPVFYVTCKNKNDLPFNVFFAKSEIEADQSIEAVPHFSRSGAVDLCEEYAKSQATHPSTVKFSRVMDLSILEYPNGRTRVKSTFKARNALNLELKFHVTCLMDTKGLFEGTIEEAR